MSRPLAGLVAAWLGAVAVAQTPAPETPEPKAGPQLRRDAEAVKRLEAYDALQYLPVDAGLKDISFSVALPTGVILDIRWKSPDKVAWTPRLAKEVPKEAERVWLLQFETPKFKAEVDAQVQSFLKSVIGEKTASKYSKDEVRRVAPDQVQIVAVAPETAAMMREATLTFDPRGLVTAIKVVSPVGAVTDMEQSYRAKGDKFLLEQVKMTNPGPTGPMTTTMKLEYVEVGAYVLVKKMELSAEDQKPAALEFSDMKVDQGLKDEDFRK